MLCIRQEKHLAKHLKLDVSALRCLADSVDCYCEELLLHDPARPEKDRPVLDVRGDLKRAQRRIHKHILLPRLCPSDHSFGGVRGRHIKMNAERHLHSKFVFSCDITHFYPSIHSSRVYRFFTDPQGCSPDVARLLTRLCTYRYHLALGLITSPLLADQFLKPIDNRIAKMAESSNLVYTRYVDDITLSGSYDLRNSGIPGTIKTMLRATGFSTKDAKEQFGRIGDPDILITKIRINRGHIDVSRKYFDDLCDLLCDLRELGNGGEFGRPYYTCEQMWGRVQFVSWVNPGRRRQLLRLYGTVSWKMVGVEAKKRGLVVSKKTLKPTRGAGRAAHVVRDLRPSLRCHMAESAALPLAGS